MARVQVVYASRHGGAEGIARRVAADLRARGADVEVADAAGGPDPRGFDAFVVGSGVYMGSWLKEGVEFVERHAATLAERPVWLFSSGPARPTDGKSDEELLEAALGPMTGPGSGGHRKVQALADAIRPRDHRAFGGRYDPKDPPKSFTERLVRMMPAAKNVLMAGDFRDWDRIDAWADSIAAEVAPAPR